MRSVTTAEQLPPSSHFVLFFPFRPNASIAFFLEPFETETGQGISVQSDTTHGQLREETATAGRGCLSRDEGLVQEAYFPL